MTDVESVLSADRRGEFHGDIHGTLAVRLATEIVRLQAEVADREADAEGFRQLALTADEEIARISAVAGSLVYALLAIRRMHSSGQFDDKGGPAMVEMALEVARRAGVGAGLNPHDVIRASNERAVEA